MTKRLFRMVVLGLLLVGLAGMRPPPSFAATPVTDCPTTETGLSADITKANSSGYNGTVTFTCTSPTIIHFDTAHGGLGTPITIGQSVTLDASGASGTVTFDGGGTTQLFFVNGGVTLTLKGLTLAHGRSSNFGGAILSFGTLTVSSSTFSSDSAPFYGGAIANAGTLTVSTSTFSADTASQVGGAIYSQGTLAVSSSTFSGNSAGLGGAIYDNGTGTVTSSTFSGNSAHIGGAIYDNGTGTVSRSTFSGNSAPYAGAISNYGALTVTSSTFSGNSSSYGGAINNAGTASVTSSTFSGNSSAVNAGALDNSRGTLTVTNSTLSGNSAPNGGAVLNYSDTTHITNSTLSGNSATVGGAINNLSGTVTIGGSIVANSPKGGNCSGTITDTGYNLSDTNCGFSPANHDLINTNPQLGPLQNNGGPTQTMALQPSSPAIDWIPAGQSGCPATGTTTDQRGYPRPDAGESVCDIGAYESSYLATTTTLASSANPSASGQPVTFTATVTPSSSGTVPTGTIQFSIDGAVSSVPLSGGKATLTTSSLAPGSHTITAAYSGDTTYARSTSKPLTQTVSPSHLSGSLSPSFHPIEGQNSSGPVASFTDTNTYISASQLTATITWGDGTTSSGTVSGSAGHFTVSGSHTYADEGSQPVSVTLQEQTPGKASGTANGTLAVTEGDRLNPSTTTAPPATASRSYSGPVAAFSDTDTANTPGDFTASVSWGDGTSSVGTISGSNGHLVVSGSHTYSVPGRYTVQTTIRDDGTGTATATATTPLLVMVPASSSGITLETDGTSACTSVASSTKVSSSGSPSGTFAFRDERPGGSPCGAYRVGVLTLQAVGIDAVVCTSHTTASIYGRATEGTYPNSSGSMVSFRADVAITSQNVPFNGTVSVQTSSGYSSGAVPASIHITGC